MAVTLTTSYQKIFEYNIGWLSSTGSISAVVEAKYEYYIAGQSARVWVRTGIKFGSGWYDESNASFYTAIWGTEEYPPSTSIISTGYSGRMYAGTSYKQEFAADVPANRTLRIYSRNRDSVNTYYPSASTYSTGDILVTIPGPSISGSVSAKTSASLNSSNGTATITPSISPGAGSLSSYSVTCNGTTKTGSGTVAAMKFTNLQNNNNYSWSITATNSYGVSKTYTGSNFYLNPVAPKNPTVSRTPSRTGCTFNLSTTYDNKRKFKQWNIRYGTSTSYGTSTTSTTLSGLQPNTNYYYAISCTDQNNGGPYSTNLTSGETTGAFTTDYNAPTNVGLENTLSMESYLTFNFSGVGDTNAPIKRYKLNYKKPQDTTFLYKNYEGESTGSVYGLDSDQDYEVYVTANNGKTTDSSHIYVATLTKAPIVGDIIVSNITPFSFTTSIQASVEMDRELKYRFSKDGGYTWTSYQTSNSYTWTGLEEETGYDLVAQVTTIHTSTYGQDNSSYSYSYITTPADQARMFVKQDDEWLYGKSYIKIDGEWVKAKKVYTKIDGEWILGKNL